MLIALKDKVRLTEMQPTKSGKERPASIPHGHGKQCAQAGMKMPPLESVDEARLSQIFIRNEEKTQAAEHEPCCYLASKQASWRRNRRASIHLSPLASVPSALLLAGSITSIPPVAQHVNPPIPPLKIPRSSWHTVVQRAAQGESLRAIAHSLNTSYEAVRRVLLAARQELLGEQEEQPPLSEEDIG